MKRGIRIASLVMALIMFGISPAEAYAENDEEIMQQEVALEVPAEEALTEEIPEEEAAAEDFVLEEVTDEEYTDEDMPDTNDGTDDPYSVFLTQALEDLAQESGSIAQVTEAVYAYICEYVPDGLDDLQTAMALSEILSAHGIENVIADVKAVETGEEGIRHVVLVRIGDFWYVLMPQEDIGNADSFSWSGFLLGQDSLQSWEPGASFAEPEFLAAHPVSEAGFRDEEEEGTDAEPEEDLLGAPQSYSYSVVPILSPMNEYLYVMTENPDPSSFRFYDNSSVYKTDSYSGVYEPVAHVYPDVVYENAGTYRVKGGYIFRNAYRDADGGTLILQVTDSNGNFKDSSVTVSCPALKDECSYLIDTYTNSSMSFFDKMDAVQAGLDALALYPRSTRDMSQPNAETPYPFLAASPYPELALNDHYEMYDYISGGTFLIQLYPYILDSLGVPGMMSDVAERLDSGCSVQWTSTHYLVNVTWNGTTKTYGGSGSGTNDPLYSNRVTKVFTFDGAGSDLGTHATLDSLSALYNQQADYATQDAEKYRDLIQGNTFTETIGAGTWIRVKVEGWGYSTNYAYAAAGPQGNDYNAKSSPWIASDTWVDGRYVDIHETLLPGETFSQHPKAGIIVRNVQYTDKQGVPHTNDVYYRYSSERDRWEGTLYYTGGWSYSPSDVNELPAELILTRDQVMQMKPDRNTNRPPASGLIYDGTAYPGTPFTVTMLSAISLPASMTMEKGTMKELTPTFTPANADHKNVAWTSDNTAVAEVNSWGYVTAKAAGTATITARSYDGGYTAACRVTVTVPQKPADGTGTGTGSSSGGSTGSGGSAGSGSSAVKTKIPSVTYRTHVQTYGWQNYVKDGEMSGTTGKSKRLEGINIQISNLPYSGGIEYRTHVQTYGWQNWVSNGVMAGTSGQAKRLEAIQIRLTGEMAKHYDVYYQTHVQTYGWTGWASNGEMCGSAGYAKRLEGIRIRLVEKGNAAPGSTVNCYYLKAGSGEPVSKVSGALVGYNTHVQTYGWQNYSYDGAMAGTSGQSKRLEGIHIGLIDKPYSGDIMYRTHVQKYGWQAWKKNGQMSGTSGEAKRLEGIQIYLTGEMAKHYDVYYRVHAQTYGWLGWAKNGTMAGTSGLSKRLEGINIVLVPKGGKAPGSTARPNVVGGGGKLPDNPYKG